MHNDDYLDFTKQLIEHQLVYITTYLQERYSVDFFLTDAKSKNHLFWIAEGSCLLIEHEDVSNRQIEHISEKVTYDSHAYLLSYLINGEDISFKISAKPVYRKQADKIVATIETIEPSIQKYLDLYSFAQFNLGIYNAPIQTHFFQNSTFDQNNFLKLTKQSLSPDMLYCVAIKDFDPNNPASPVKLLCAGEKVRERRSVELFNLVHENRSLMIYACCKTGSYNPNMDYAQSVRHSHEEVMGEFSPPYTVNTGVGSPHTPDNLYHSYREAFLSLAVGTLQGKTNFVYAFRDLKEYTLLLDHPIKELVKHSTAFMQPLFQLPDGLLQFETLRNLLDNGLRYKVTASQMYVHPNTLHYRINKALSVLDLDLANTGDISLLHTEIRLYDILHFCDFIEMPSSPDKTPSL